MILNRSATLFLSLSLSALILDVASAQTSPGIVGVWRLKTDQMDVESIYAPDGAYTCHITPAAGPGRTVTGKYTLDGAKLRVHIDGRDQATTYTWDVRGDTLELTDDKGNSTRMDRKPGEKPAAPLPIVGEWLLRNEQLEFRLTLNGDGTFSRVTRAGGKEDRLRGRWQVDGERCELAGEDGKKLPFKWRLIEPGQLELKGDDGSALQLVRVGAPPVSPGPAVRRDPLFGPGYGPAFRARPADAPMADYLKEVVPDAARLDKLASGHILYTHVESIRLPEANAALPAAKTYIMTGEGAGQTPFIRPKGIEFVWAPAWSKDGKKIVFASNFQSTRSSQYIDLFLADLPAGTVRRLTGVEAWAPVKGRGRLTVTVVVDVKGQGAPATTDQINIAVQTCDGRLFKLQEKRKVPDGSPPAFFAVIPDCPSGNIWVKTWMNRFIGDVTNIVLPTGGSEECVLSLSGGNYMSTCPQISPDGRYVVYVAEKTQFVRVREPDWSNPKAPPPAVAHQGYSTMAVFDVRQDCPVASWPGDKLGIAIDPKLSPDGQTIAFANGNFRDENIAICSLKSLLAGRPEATVLVKNEWRLQEMPPYSIGNCQPAWSPDGKRIAFVRYAMGTPDFTGNIFLVNADGTGLARLTDLPANVFPGWPTWSPDGKRIAFQVMTGKGKVFTVTERGAAGTPVDIWSISVDGADLKQLTKDGASGEPNWGP
ncbi:MAG: hypothetical protein PHU85_02115 [Phycisphaerae bacterium]|nr:hypothetical protein [Phycisphaerae bacterium]